MLLDIVVEQLEDKCYTKTDDGKIIPKSQRKRYQDEQIQLLKMLSEIIRVSDDSQLKQGEQSQQVEAEQDASN